MRIKRKFEIIPAMILVFSSIALSGCSQGSSPEVIKTGNTNQAPTNLTNNSAAVVNPSSSPIATTVNNTSPAINNASSNVNNTFVPTGNKDKKSSGVVKEPAPQIGSGGNDMFLLAQTRSALSSDEELLNSVIVEIKGGNVVLTGSVSSEAQKTKAGQLIQTVKGLKSVKNNLRVLR